jgi:hypothetical protein
MRGGIYFRPSNEDLLPGPRLGKMPLGVNPSVKSRIETAVAASKTGETAGRERISLFVACGEVQFEPIESVRKIPLSERSTLWRKSSK